MAQESLRSDAERDMEVSGGSASQSFWRPKASPSSGWGEEGRWHCLLAPMAAQGPSRL